MALTGPGTGNYHLTSEQWLEADIYMQHQASLPIDVREKRSVLVRHVQKHCFHRTHKIPSCQAISKRYIKIFLGSKEHNPSLIERADTMLESAARGENTQDGFEPDPVEIVKAVKFRYFAKSTSGLHTLDGIEHRYRQIEATLRKWRDPDLQFRWAASQGFATGPVVAHIKKDFFAHDLSVTDQDIEDRYCRKFLGIANHSNSIKGHNMRSDAEFQRYALGTKLENRSTKSTTQTPFSETLPQRQKTMGNSDPYLPQTSVPVEDTALGVLTDQQSRSLNYSYPFKRSPVNTHKRVRPDSLASSRSIHVSPRKNSQPTKEMELRIKLKDLGFDAGDVSAADLRSLPSRLKRCSVEVVTCPRVHKPYSQDNPCPICYFPVKTPKPRIFIAPEFASTPRAEEIDADDMDNGIMTMNADKRYLI